MVRRSARVRQVAEATAIAEAEAARAAAAKEAAEAEAERERAEREAERVAAEEAKREAKRQRLNRSIEIDPTARDPAEVFSDEVFLYIAQWLSPEDLAACSLVSRTWHRIVEDASVWRALHAASGFVTADEHAATKASIDETVARALEAESVATPQSPPANRFASPAEAAAAAAMARAAAAVSATSTPPSSQSSGRSTITSYFSSSPSRASEDATLGTADASASDDGGDDAEARRETGAVLAARLWKDAFVEVWMGGTVFRDPRWGRYTRAPSGRATCFHCRHKIPQGALRCVTWNFDHQTPPLIHACCDLAEEVHDTHKALYPGKTLNAWQRDRFGVDRTADHLELTPGEKQAIVAWLRSDRNLLDTPPIIAWQA